MTTEEKAKAYDEALETARKINSREGVEATPGWTICEVIFPELKESEDERIRKAILAFIKRCPDARKITTKEYSKWIEYLEKQKNTISCYEEKLDRCVCENFNKGIKEVLSHPEEYGLVKRQEQKPAQWSEDKRIRKTLISIVKWLGFDSSFFTDNSVTKSEVLSYLKKQKEQKPSINIDQLKSMMLQYLQEAANEKDDSDIEADTDKWARMILRYDFEQKPETKLTGWVARDENGEIYAYEDYPEKDSEMWIGSNSMLLDRKSFPDLKWENGPVEVEVTIRKK